MASTWLQQMGQVVNACCRSRTLRCHWSSRRCGLLHAVCCRTEGHSQQFGKLTLCNAANSQKPFSVCAFNHRVTKSAYVARLTASDRFSAAWSPCEHATHLAAWSPCEHAAHYARTCKRAAKRVISGAVANGTEDPRQAGRRQQRERKGQPFDIMRVIGARHGHPCRARITPCYVTIRENGFRPLRSLACLPALPWLLGSRAARRYDRARKNAAKRVTDPFGAWSLNGTTEDLRTTTDKGRGPKAR